MLRGMSDTREWTFTSRDGESRTFQQQELTIDGEAALFGLIAGSVVELQKKDFPFDRVADLFPEEGEDGEAVFGPDTLSLASQMATVIATTAPHIIPKAAAILLGIFPTDEYGKPNKDYNETVAFLRKSIHAADAAEMFQTFVEQNDVQRLTVPFVTAVGMVSRAGENLPTRGSTQTIGAKAQTRSTSPATTS